MKKRTDKIVYIPQLQLKRTIYTEDGHKYIMIEKNWLEMDGYKNMMKEVYGINISYEDPETMYDRRK